MKKSYVLWILMAVVVSLLGVESVKADSAVAPFVDSQTSLVIYLDLSNLDTDALSAFEQKAIAGMPDPAQRAKQQADAAKGIASAKKWIGDFKTAGGKDLYVVISLAGLMQGTPGGLIVPLNGTDGTALAKVFNPRGNPPAADPNDPNAAQQSRMQPQTAVVGDAMIFSTGSGIAKLKTASIEPRQDLVDALAAGDTATLKVAATPAMLKNNPLFGAIVNSRMRMGNAGAAPTPPFSEPQWDNVTWVSVAVNAPPKESGKCSFQCKDADSATALSDMLTKKIADGRSDVMDKHKMSPEDYDKLAAAMKPSVSGTQVLISLDQDTIDNIVVPMLTKMMQQQQAQNPGGGGPAAPADGGGGM